MGDGGHGDGEVLSRRGGAREHMLVAMLRGWTTWGEERTFARVSR